LFRSSPRFRWFPLPEAGRAPPEAGDDRAGQSPVGYARHDRALPKADGTDAYNSALTYYTLAKYSQAIPLFEEAVRLLPDGDPGKKSAQDRLAEAKNKQ
jgi:hypothetical protein